VENDTGSWRLFGGQLPDHPNHPKGRNPYAHVAICVKDHFNASYKDIPDENLMKL
jgi:hypothetical protein